MAHAGVGPFDLLSWLYVMLTMPSSIAWWIYGHSQVCFGGIALRAYLMHGIAHMPLFVVVQGCAVNELNSLVRLEFEPKFVPVQ